MVSVLILKNEIVNLMNNYSIYKITNTVNNYVYIGSTKGRKGRNTLNNRFTQHKNDKRVHLPLYKMIQEIGINNFQISLIKEIICTKRIANIQEQIELWNVPKDLRLNILRAYTHNIEKTRDNEKKKKVRRDYYHRKRQDPEWCLKEKERCRIKDRKRRAVRD